MPNNTVVKLAQELIIQDQRKGREITVESINDHIKRILSLYTDLAENVDQSLVVDELIRRTSEWIGKAGVLAEEGHAPWLTGERMLGRRYWPRYREYLERSLAPAVIEEIDKSTDQLLDLLADPKRNGPWDRRGLVVGNVQAGKTGHYIGLINKAADAGYKIIIVLAGLHNNLRSQTQIRLDEGFLGYDTSRFEENIRPIIGVGEIDTETGLAPNTATTRSDKGDFTTKVANHLAVSPEQRPWLFVVKKHGGVLKHLYKWINNQVADVTDAASKRRIVTKLPLLMIDDEADHASVDTGSQYFDENGKPDENYTPKVINGWIRRILLAFSRSAYVGYTATPFANIFIHEKGSTRDEGDDLFPSSFIMNMATPTSHVGPARVFGRMADEIEGLPLVRIIDDDKNNNSAMPPLTWLPIKHAGHYRLPDDNGSQMLPVPLEEAILSFILSCAVRKLRGQGKEHCSMLIHVTRYTAVQKQIHQQVESFCKYLRQRLMRNLDAAEYLKWFEQLWNKPELGFIAVNKTVREMEPDQNIPGLPDYQDIMAVIPEVISELKVKSVNGTAKDALDYDEYKGIGLKAIVIGGDKLSRGLTLHGLTTSYFQRTSKMYDTLMQMGRWFGYRPGYLDVCRLYTTKEMVRWYRHIAEADEELRLEFSRAIEAGMTPRQYGLKVKAHPQLLITSKVKMRNSTQIQISFSGHVMETVSFYSDQTRLDKNMVAFSTLIESLGVPHEQSVKRNWPGKSRSWPNSSLWHNVESERVIDFLQGYQTHPSAHKVNNNLLSEFIQKMNADSKELTKWVVVALGTTGGPQHQFSTGVSVGLTFRKPSGDVDDHYAIGRLLSSDDETIILDSASWAEALALTVADWARDDSIKRAKKKPPDVPSGPFIRQVADPGTGLLILYLLDPDKANVESGSPPVAAFGLSFPGSSATTRAVYNVNNVYREQEYGQAVI